ncbi:MAG: hypothetical protein ACR2ML_06775, partial [Solirubrobacteraceae bacterium]
RTSFNGRQSINTSSLDALTGPAIRQYLYYQCRYDRDDANCSGLRKKVAPTFDNDRFSHTEKFLHQLGRKYYTNYNFYFRSLGNPNPSRPDGKFHPPPLRSAVFTCRTTDRLCRFEPGGNR